MKASANRYLKRIASMMGEQDVGRATEIFIRNQREGTDSLEMLAKKLGVTSIAEETLPFEGALYALSDSQFAIKLNSQSSPVRKRFTLAHEIGHLLLGAVPGFRSSCGNDLVLERACDSIAAELLMPRDEAIEFVRSLGKPAPEKLKVIASKYSVSLPTAAIRVHSDFHLWKCCIGLWEREPKIRTVWFIGRRRWDSVEPDSYSLDLALCSGNSVRTQELWQRGPSTSPVWLDLLRIGNGRVLGLVNFVN